jgi:iron complex transport system ATP-binding protein
MDAGKGREVTLSVQDLTVTIGNRIVCRNLDLAVDTGSRWAILGINGVGKTTLLLTLAGLRAPDAGLVAVDGVKLDTLTPRDRARCLGLMAQEDSFHISDPEVTAFEVALLGRLPHLDWWRPESERDETLARTALEAVGLTEIAGRRAATLSGGERRRLALAALLAQEVPLCLLDEPTSHLDMHQQIALLDLLNGWDGRTLIMTLHEVNLATQYCTHVLLLFGDGAWCAGPVGEMLSAAVLTRLYGHPVDAIPGPQGLVYVPKVGAGVTAAATPKTA